MQAKLRDIASELNLSVSTISRVVNGKDRVAPETRRMVLGALEAAGYRPNEVARSLRRRTVKTIVIVVPDIANNYYASIIKGAQSVCRDREYSVMVYDTNEDPALERQLLQGLSAQQPAGLILASVTSSAAQVRTLNDFPVVFVDNIPPAFASYYSVSINNVAASYTLTTNMIRRGYARIGFITGTLTQSSGSERLEGYRQALLEAGLPFDEALIAAGDFKGASGYAGMQTLLAHAPDAVIVSNNFMTFGAMHALRDAGLRVPEDIAIAGFDIVDETGLLTPQITSINQPAAEIGEKAAAMLLQCMNDGSRGAYEHLLLSPVFLAGNSW